MKRTGEDSTFSLTMTSSVCKSLLRIRWVDVSTSSSTDPRALLRGIQRLPAYEVHSQYLSMEVLEIDVYSDIHPLVQLLMVDDSNSDRV